jgi:hypothetical protein
MRDARPFADARLSRPSLRETSLRGGQWKRRRVLAARRQKLVEQGRQFGDNGLFCDAQAHLFLRLFICVLGNRSRGGRGSERTGDTFHGARAPFDDCMTRDSEGDCV